MSAARRTARGCAALVRGSMLVAAALAMNALCAFDSAAQPATQALACPGLYPGGTVPFSGLNPAIEERLPLSRFRPHEIVEIDTTTMPEAQVREHIRELQRLPARVSTYLPGGHCNLRNKDCETLTGAGVRIARTGSWNWDKDERRIIDVSHPAVLARIRRGAERAWRLGANYVRVDNVHDPAGSTVPRTIEQLERVFREVQTVEDELRAAEVIPPDRPTGIVAHNNLELWEQMIRSKRLARPPVFLTSERTAQLAFKGQGYLGDAKMKAGQLRPGDVGEIAAARRIALALDIPYSIAEFQVSHDLAGKPGQTYRLPAAYVAELSRLPGVTEVFVVPSETHYVGRGAVHDGPGSRVLAAQPQARDAADVAAACLLRKGAG